MGEEPIGRRISCEFLALFPWDRERRVSPAGNCGGPTRPAFRRLQGDQVGIHGGPVQDAAAVMAATIPTIPTGAEPASAEVTIAQHRHSRSR